MRTTAPSCPFSPLSTRRSRPYHKYEPTQVELLTSRPTPLLRRLVDAGAYSSSIPDNGARKLVDGAVLTDQLGTPRERCDEHNSKFSLSYETKV
jgi:hypothetical protein